MLSHWLAYRLYQPLPDFLNPAIWVLNGPIAVARVLRQTLPEILLTESRVWTQLRPQFSARRVYEDRFLDRPHPSYGCEGEE